MGWEAIKWAWPHQTSTPAAKTVLLALAQHADKAGRCWPGLDTLARMTSCSRATVIRSLASLEADGLIERERSRGGGGGLRATTRYLVRLDRQVSHRDTPNEGLSQSATPECVTTDAECLTVEPGLSQGETRIGMNQKESSSAASPTPQGQAADFISPAEAFERYFSPRYHRPKLRLVEDGAA